MALTQDRPASGHAFRINRPKGLAWFAKHRLPEGRQVQ
jgi:hypothetical protein